MACSSRVDAAADAPRTPPSRGTGRARAVRTGTHSNACCCRHRCAPFKGYGLWIMRCGGGSWIMDYGLWSAGVCPNGLWITTHSEKNRYFSAQNRYFSAQNRSKLEVRFCFGIKTSDKNLDATLPPYDVDYSGLHGVLMWRRIMDYGLWSLRTWLRIMDYGLYSPRTRLRIMDCGLYSPRTQLRIIDYGLCSGVQARR